jgi:N-methylhydantoinase A/oxoprolinase/acetone carboxylase beta subunit
MFAAAAGATDAALYLRADLKPGDQGRGPALVVEDQTTTVVGADFAFQVDARGYLVLERATDRPEAGP